MTRIQSSLNPTDHPCYPISQNLRLLLISSIIGYLLKRSWRNGNPMQWISQSHWFDISQRLVKDQFKISQGLVLTSTTRRSFFTDSQSVVSVGSVYLTIHSITFFFRNNFFSTTFRIKYTPLYIYTYIYFIYIFLYIYIYIYKRI